MPPPPALFSENAEAQNKELVMTCDQNIDYLKLNTNNHALELLDIKLKHKLIPTLVRPTRITHSTATLIDDIYITSRLRMIPHL